MWLLPPPNWSFLEILNITEVKLIASCVLHSYCCIVSRLEIILPSYSEVITAGDFNRICWKLTKWPQVCLILTYLLLALPHLYILYPLLTLLYLLFVPNVSIVLHYNQLVAPVFSIHDAILVKEYQFFLNQYFSRLSSWLWL